MPENKPFVINDRRKFTTEGELRPDVPHEPQAEDNTAPVPPSSVAAAPESASAAEAAGPHLVKEQAAEPEPQPAAEPSLADSFPPPPTPEQNEQANRAYSSTVERLDTAIRATNPGMERLPAMNFERLVQSLYMQALLQLGGAAEPGQTPQVDLLGARQTIDMLALINEKSRGNLTDAEDKLVQSALFELRMGFLEITQALARSAASKAGAPGGMPGVPGGGPSIVR